jgi:hypothetical protein
LEEPRGVEGSGRGGNPRAFPGSAILTEVLATAPVLGWLTAQALYVAEPLLQSFVSSQTLARWAQTLEGDEEMQ